MTANGHGVVYCLEIAGTGVRTPFWHGTVMPCVNVFSIANSVNYETEDVCLEITSGYAKLSS